MICNPTDDGWEVIFQRAHALLAAKLLVPLDRENEPRWFETLNAVAQHDHGWQEWESLSPLTKVGEPRNFLDTPAEESEKQARRAVQRALHQSCWSGLLVARHVTSLYRDNEEKCLRRLLSDLEIKRKEWREYLGVTMEDEDYTYQYLSWADTLSLLLCLQPSDRLGPAEPKLHGKAYKLEGKGSHRRLSPWPYPVESVSVTVEAHYLRQRVFSSKSELARALAESNLKTKSWTLFL